VSDAALGGGGLVVAGAGARVARFFGGGRAVSSLSALVFANSGSTITSQPSNGARGYSHRNGSSWKGAMVRDAVDVLMRGAGMVVEVGAGATAITITMGLEGSRSWQNGQRGVMGKGGGVRSNFSDDAKST